MSRPSNLYKRVGWTSSAPLFRARLDTNEVLDDDDIIKLNIRRGANDPSTHTPSSLTLSVRRTINFASSSVSIDLSDQAAAHLAGRTGANAQAIQTRFFGRRGATRATDGVRGWTTTELTAASWDSVLTRSPDTWAPGAGASITQGVRDTLNPSWSPARAGVQGTTDTLYEAPAEPMHAGEILDLLADRLYLFAPQRNGQLLIRSLDQWINAAAAATTTWPLARAHVLAPTEWDQPSDQPTEYQVTLRTPAGGIHTIVTSPNGAPSGTVRLEALDWSDLVAQTEHWRRLHGERARTLQSRFHLPKLRIPLHRLINHPKEGHRRAAGMLLTLQVGDPVPLSGDWPTFLDGITYATSITEEITHQGWWMDLSLWPYRWLNGEESPTPRPRTWAQTRQQWQTPTQTWQEGPAA